MSLPQSETSREPGKCIRRSLFRSMGAFGYLNCAQFLGAINDNIFKLLIVFCFIDLKGDVSSGSAILATVGATYVIPFLLFSSTAGTIADRYSKRTIIVITKFLELAIVCFGMVGFYLKDETLTLVALFLLGTHSSLFGPCKYGIVPEIVPPERISRANGLLTSFTYIAIIFGTFLAAFLTEVTGRNFVLSSAMCAIFSLLGICAALCIPKTAPSGSQKSLSPRFVTEHIRNLRLISKYPSLLSGVVGSSFFLFVGAFVQLNLIPFAMDVLGLSDVQGGYLFLLTALGIGAGATLAGKISGKAVELGLVPIGGIGIAISCFFIDINTHHLPLEMLFIFLVGVFGGLYIVPLDSFIQVNSPHTHVGQVVATTNFLGFCGVLCSSGLLYLLGEIMGLPPNVGFLVIACLVVLMITGITLSIYGYVVRFGSFLLARIRYPTVIEGQAAIPLLTPSLFFVHTPFWPWAVVLQACQRRRMHLFFFKDESKGNSVSSQPICWQERLERAILSTTALTNIQELYPGGAQAERVLYALKRGTSVAIFCDAQAALELRTRWEAHPQVPIVPYFQVDQQVDRDVPHQLLRFAPMQPTIPPSPLPQ